MTVEVAERGDHAKNGATSGFTSTREATVAVKHRVVHRAAPTHSVLENALPSFPVRVTTIAVRTQAAAVRGSILKAPLTNKGASGRRITGHRGNVMFPASDGQTVPMQANLPFLNGAAADVAAFGTVGTISLSTFPIAFRGKNQAISVEQSSAVFVVSDPSSATAGMSLNGTLTAKDAYGNTVTGFDGNVTLTGADGQPLHVAAQTAFTNGTPIFAVPFDAPNMVTLDAVSSALIAASTARASAPVKPHGLLPSVWHAESCPLDESVDPAPGPHPQSRRGPGRRPLPSILIGTEVNEVNKEFER